ncbi:MHYT domain-containing protein [Streptomyces sp. TRM76323]|uniref:MHYT domain-containing protein n=1 Tax=Streptomyces tamarix TaxID=3078565 RepID=A0ABU3QFH3_9ACTN|nr:MHYT domain-containing protein [Streptomyces tamarix]MDT9681431.1 MHYT domain-containing protein [Streptomyces tamarix]
MRGTVEGFSHGLITPVVAYLMACLGGALGLRCTTRSLRASGAPHPGWLALGAVSIGAGVWTMHFVAMTGFRIEGVPIGYDRPITFASLAVAILMAGVGILVVGLRGRTAMALVTGGTITGLGIATMHYLGMAGMRLPGRVEYHTPTVALSVVIAVAAATAALWATVSVRGFAASVGASLVLGLAVTGMHYTGMAAATVHLHGGATAASGRSGPADPAGAAGAAKAAGAAGAAGTADAAGAGAAGAAGGAPDVTVAADGGTAPLVPLLAGPAAFLVLAGVVVLFDPTLVGGDGPGRHPADPRAHRPGVPAPRHRDHDAGR